LTEEKGPLGILPVGPLRKKLRGGEGLSGQLEKRFYYCDNPRHPHSEIIQILTYQTDPKCPVCGQIMTYGRYWG